MKKIYFFLIALLLTLSAGAQTLRGDVNGDGTVDVADVTELVDIILNGDKEEPDTPAVPEEPATDSRAIDLGLSVKWASCNVDATAPEEYGGYYAWGETQEKSNYDWSTYKYCNGTSTSMTKYCTNSDHGTVDNKTTLEPEDDVAHVKWGGSWRMPTEAEQDELRDKCTWTWTTLNGVNGYRVTGPNGNSIFLPAAGYRFGTEVDDRGSSGYYWSSTLRSYYGSYACYLDFDSSTNRWDGNYRYNGRTVRPVCDDATETPVVNYTITVSSSGNGTVAINGTSGTTATIKEGDNVTITATPGSGEEFAGWYTDGGETLVSTEATYTFVASANVALIAKFNTKPATDSRAIDLGLPSGIKWASCNVGATEPEEYGGYYAWGETQEKSTIDWSTNDWNTDDWSIYKYCNGSSTSMTKYCTNSSYGIVDNKTTLEPDDDVAHVKWGGSWRMPTKAEQQELLNNCTWTWTTLNGVNGYRVTGSNGNSIFLPAAGFRSGVTGDFGQGSWGEYWSGSLHSFESNLAYGLTFVINSNSGSLSSSPRYCGYPVRPVCE